MATTSYREQTVRVPRARSTSKWPAVNGQVVPDVGDTLGSYRLLEVLGEGAGGKVFLAEHVLLGRQVAIKMLHPKLTAHPALVRRFFEEARSVTQIEHENIVSITDFVVGETHPSFYVMEFLRGQTLAERLATGEALALPDILRIATQLCAALRAVHARGVVHRDVKPANIFLTERADGMHVKLLDFGIAKFIEHSVAENANADPSVPDAGSLVGTPRYMSPEAVLDDELDGRADIYALGVVLYEMFAGTVPFDGDSIPEVLEGHVTLEPTSLLDASNYPVSGELDALIQDMLAKFPVDRPESAEEVLARLRFIEAKLGLAPVRVSEFSDSRGQVLLRLGLTMLAAAAVIFLFAYNVRQSMPQFPAGLGVSLAQNPPTHLVMDEVPTFERVEDEAGVISPRALVEERARTTSAESTGFVPEAPASAESPEAPLEPALPAERPRRVASETPASPEPPALRAEPELAVDRPSQLVSESRDSTLTFDAPAAQKTSADRGTVRRASKSRTSRTKPRPVTPPDTIPPAATLNPFAE